MSYDVVARYVADEGKGDAVAAALVPHIRQTRAEPGNTGFTVLRSTGDCTVFVLVESYIDEDAFAAHAGSSHYQRNVVETIRPMLVERTVEFFTRVEPEGSDS